MRFDHQAAVLACALGEGPRAFGEGLIMEYASAHLCLDFPVPPLTCMYDGARLDLEMENDVSGESL